MQLLSTSTLFSIAIGVCVCVCECGTTHKHGWRQARKHCSFFLQTTIFLQTAKDGNEYHYRVVESSMAVSVPDAHSNISLPHLSPVCVDDDKIATVGMRPECLYPLHTNKSAMLGCMCVDQVNKDEAVL